MIMLSWVWWDLLPEHLVLMNNSSYVRDVLQKLIREPLRICIPLEPLVIIGDHFRQYFKKEKKTPVRKSTSGFITLKWFRWRGTTKFQKEWRILEETVESRKKHQWIKEVSYFFIFPPNNEKRDFVFTTDGSTMVLVVFSRTLSFTAQRRFIPSAVVEI